LLAKYLDGDPLAKAKVEIIQARILAGPLNTKSTKRTDVKLKLKEKSKSDG
jgi:LPS O-antigen subunit length determinant protein (WzzB/FepE family)